jgi:hypothetical protein
MPYSSANLSNSMNSNKKMLQEWESNTFPDVERGSDSLLNMAASLFHVESLTRTISPAPTAEEITSHQTVDFFDSSNGGCIFDISELEPIPLNPDRMNIVAECFPLQNSNKNSFQVLQQLKQHQQQQQRLKLSILEETLNQVQQLALSQQAPGRGMVLDLFQPPSLSIMLPTSPPPQPKRTYDKIVTPPPPPPRPPQVPTAKRRKMDTPFLHPDKQESAVKKQRTLAHRSENVPPPKAIFSEEELRRFRPYQSNQWTEKFQELLDFCQAKGHCSVPHTLEENPSLARWVKRQRYQFKLKNEGKTSTMTDDRVVSLEKVGFIWDSHGAAWVDRMTELKAYKLKHDGSCNVPSNCPSNPQLATWIKCQRRQRKLFLEGKSSNMTEERIVELESLGFEWELRCGTNKKKANKEKQQAVLFRV